MKPPEYYRGREQTYLKHFFLERYLERVAYNIGSFAEEFVYVDGFSGPWQSADEALDDTSFMIAIKKLREVRDGLSKRFGRHPRIRCLFIEQDVIAFGRLTAAIQQIDDLEIQPLHGEFIERIPDILRFMGSAFALVFIDPTGWTGFGLSQITPVLQHRPGEVIVNFMFDHINRFLDDKRPEISASFTELFGGPGWERVVEAGDRREDAVVQLYGERMRAAGEFVHVTSTRIMKPEHDRSYFYLVYGTRHPKGLIEFRNVERRAVQEQERVRLTAKQEGRIKRTGQLELFDAAENSTGARSFERDRGSQQDAALELLRMLVRAKQEVRFEDARASLLELPLVWESDVSTLTLELRDAGELEIRGLQPPARTPKPGHFLVSISKRST